MSLNLAPSYPHPPWDFKDKDRDRTLYWKQLYCVILYSYATVVKRWPVIITNIIDTVYRAVDAEGNSSPEKVAEGKALISQLSKLKYDMSHDRPLAEIPEDGGLNSKVYNDRLQDLEKSGNNTWMKIPWLFGEYVVLLKPILFAIRYIKVTVQLACNTQKYGALVGGINGLWPLFHVFNRLEELAQVMVDIEGRRKEFEQGGDGWEDKLAIVFAEMLPDELQSFANAFASLGGNATDLSMLPSMDPADVALLQAVGEDKAHLILRNDAGALWNHVRSLRDARLDFVLDNGVSKYHQFGVHAWLTIGCKLDLSKAVFHPKPIPWFVSDVTPRDWDAIFRALKDPDFFTMLDPSMAHPNALKKMVERWEAYTQTGLFALAPEETYAFWAAPGGYWEVAPGMDGEVVGKILDGSGLVIFKRWHFSYRKLTGDIKWPNTTPWEEAIGTMNLISLIVDPMQCYHTGPLAGRFPLLSLRTCKADVVVGLDKDLVERLDGDPKEKGWRAGGKQTSDGDQE
ncbi:DUF89 domain-containing protein [Rhizoctonia solani AG-1 IA]|uniref:Sugar phosphate phosphatase n=1 Tax=Thanatephorus cucumeris (strain AG1-IA) TaxID=983506 RepID=L8WPJ8_THACA|nr:DUF89 domain-containing protein [Rhizoctonia solani AG-1 IA]